MFNFENYKLKNLQISKASFDKDISNCNLVFFRGSYSAIKACKNGLFPIYINFPSDFDTDINPLYEIEDKVIKLSDPKKFKKIVKYVQASKSSKRKLYITNHCNKINLKLEKKYIKDLISNF